MLYIDTIVQWRRETSAKLHEKLHRVAPQGLNYQLH